MNSSPSPKVNLLVAAVLVTVLGLAVPTVLVIEALLERWLALGLLVVFGALVTQLPQETVESRQFRFYGVLGIQYGLLLAMLLLFPQAEALVSLFYILSIEAMLYSPVSKGWPWLLITSLTATIYLFSQGGFRGGIGDVMTFLGGMLLFSLVSALLRSARMAQRRSDKLLQELQSANRQLKEYADQVETASVNTERIRLAREMHDTVGHHLATATVQLEAARKLALQDAARASELVTNSQEQVREALSELRQTVGRLREPLEADLQLEQALPRLAESVRQTSGIMVHLEMPASPLRLPDTHRLAIYRAAQEGLTNVVRHASARQAWLSLRRQQGSVVFEIGDDGRGLPEDFNLDTPGRSTSFGLRGMHERVEQLGGSMELSGRPESGTRLLIQLPITREETDA